jgi:hypothetical protein
MGVIVKPKNLNERQINRVDRIRETNPERARRVADRISDRRNARGAETDVKPIMKKGGKVAKKMKSGGTVSMQLGSYKNTIGKNTKGKATKAVGLTKAKYGKAMSKKK